MDRTSRTSFIIIGIIISAVLLVGFRNLSHSVKHNDNRKYISVSGFAEKKVRSDIAELRINIKNKGEDFKKLYAKRVEDKKKVIDFLKNCGITDEEIISITVKSDNMGEKESFYGNVLVTQEKYYSSEDAVFIRSANFEKIDKIKNQIMQLASEGVIISYKCEYKILEPERLRAEMMSLAAKNARANAEAVIQPFNKSITSLDNISCDPYSMTISTEASTTNSYWLENEKEDTPNKNVRLSIHAEFSFK